MEIVQAAILQVQILNLSESVGAQCQLQLGSLRAGVPVPCAGRDGGGDGSCPARPYAAVRRQGEL